MKPPYPETHQLKYDEYFDPTYSEPHWLHHCRVRHCLKRARLKPLFRYSRIDHYDQTPNLNEHRDEQGKSLAAREFPNAHSDNH